MVTVPMVIKFSCPAALAKDRSISMFNWFFISILDSARFLLMHDWFYYLQESNSISEIEIRIISVYHTVSLMILKYLVERW